MRAALYARVSTTDHDQDPEVQLLQLRKFAELRGWEVFAEYIDTCSGKTPMRPGLKAAEIDAKSRSYDVFLALRIDRIMRSVKHFYNFADTLEICGVRICTCDGIDYSTPIGRLIRGVLLDVAQFEGELIVERTKEGHEKARASGVIIGRPAIELDIEQVLELLQQGLTKGKVAELLGCSPGTINNRLRAAGLEHLVGKPTRGATKRGMLENSPSVKYSVASGEGGNNRSVLADTEVVE